MPDELLVEVAGGLEGPVFVVVSPINLATWWTTPRPMRSIIPKGPIPLCRVIIQVRSMLWKSLTPRTSRSSAAVHQGTIKLLMM